MARVVGPARRSGPRPFTAAELARIRELTAAPLPSAQRRGRSARSILEELDRIHVAAGRRRTFKLWAVDVGAHDAEAAFLEEVGSRGAHHRN